MNGCDGNSSGQRQLASAVKANFNLPLKFKYNTDLMITVFCCCFCTDGWTTADLVFLWKEGDPVQVVKNLHLPRFTLEKFLTDYCNSKTNTGELTDGLVLIVMVFF